MLKAATLFVFVLFSAAAVEAQENADKSREYLFEIRANGFRYGDFSVVLSEDARTYQVDVTAEAKGIFGFLLQAKYSGSSSGTIKPNANRQGTEFTARSSRILVNRTQSVTYQSGQPTTVSVLPPRRRTALSDPQQISGKYNDPLSFLANLVENVGPNCPASANLYDGRRITKVTFGSETLQSSTVTCDGIYEIVDGPDHSLQKGVRKFGVVSRYDRGETGALTLNSVDFESKGNVITLTRLGK
jgi:uncharacterized protein DUF3108